MTYQFPEKLILIIISAPNGKNYLYGTGNQIGTDCVDIVSALIAVLTKGK